MLCYRCGTYAPDGSPKCPGCGQIFQKSTNGEKRKSSQTRQPQAIFSVGETVAERYKILDVIGLGGVGTVYRAHDTDIDVEVALKAVAPKLLQTADEQKTFSKFIKTARKLHHANIVRIYDEGRDTGPQGERRFFTMQLLEGLTLRKIIQLRREKSQVFQVAEVEPIFQQLAAAMDYAHKTVWHGDLKPENVLVLPDLLKVTDFCIIQALPTKPFLAIQKSRGAAYHYIAPEVRLEASRIDGRADVYSLGVMLAEMLTGELYEGHANKNYQKALELSLRSDRNAAFSLWLTQLTIWIGNTEKSEFCAPAYTHFNAAEQYAAQFQIDNPSTAIAGYESFHNSLANDLALVCRKPDAIPQQESTPAGEP